MLTVHELRKRGFKIRVQHNRCFEYRKKGVGREFAAKPLSKGGATEVLITRPKQDAISAIGIAECSPNDNFDRKRGVRIALGRALKQLGLPTK